MPWSIFMTLRTKVDALHHELMGFRRALARALQWIRHHEAQAIPACVQHRFPGFDTDETVRIVQRYKTLGTDEWAETPRFEEANVSNRQDALGRCGLLEQHAPLDEMLEFNSVLHAEGDGGAELHASWQRTAAELGSAR